MALIVITLQDGDDGIAIGVQAEPTPPRVVSRLPPTPAQQLATAMLNLAQMQPNPPANASGLVLVN